MLEAGTMRLKKVGEFVLFLIKELQSLSVSLRCLC